MAGEQYTFTREQTRRIRAAVLGYENEQRGSQVEVERGWRARGSTDATKWYPCYNAGSQDIAPHSLVALAAPSKLSGRWHWNVRRPDTTFSRYYGVTGFHEIAQTKRGAVALNGIVRVAYDAGTPAYGDGWGAKPSQFTASIGYPECLFVHGIIDGTAKIMQAELHPIDELLVKTSASHAKGASQSCDVYAGATKGSESDTTINVTCYNRFADLDSGSWGLAKWVNGGLELFAGECPA